MNEQGAMMNQKPPPQPQHHLMNLNQNMMGMNQMNPQSQPQMLPMNRGYGMWPQQQLPPSFQKPNLNPNSGAMKPPLSSSSFKKPLGPRNNWKGKKVNKPNDKRRNEQQKPLMASNMGGRPVIPNFNNYQPPTLNELQHQNRMKTRKFFPKKFNNKNMNLNMIANNHNFNNSRSAPFAPRNTTSFIIRAKKSGGIASLVSPSPVTPAVLPTPIFSPSREVLVDMAKEEWGVDGYGSMKGLIRLRSPGHEMEAQEDEDEEEGGSSESDVEEHVEVERRLDHDLSRFEMIYNPSSVNVVGSMDYHNMLENRVDDQDSRIAHLEEENLILKERLFLMERELGELSRRMQCLERRGSNEEVVENESENESGSREGHSVEDNNEEFSGDTNGGGAVSFEKEQEKTDDTVGEDDKSGKVCDVEGKEGNNNEEFVDASHKINGVCDFEDKTENNDGMMIAEADNGDGKEYNNYNNDQPVEGKYTEENKHEEDKNLNMEVNASDNNIDVESSGSVMAGGDISMGEVGIVKEVSNTVLSRDVGN